MNQAANGGLPRLASSEPRNDTNVVNRFIATLKLIKCSHTIFALPFALGAMWLAADGWPGWKTLLLILAAMVTARSAAMAFNRLADAKMDAENPRTASRPLTAGTLSRWYVVVFTMAMAALFLITTRAINLLAYQLAPIALLLVFGYSLAKRVTWLTHLILGTALGLAPIAAQVAVAEEITLPFVCLGLAVTCWVAGFDILYATHDVDFDRAHGLHSIPARFGIARALGISRMLHTFAALGFFCFGFLADLGPWYDVSAAAMALALIYEQSLVHTDDLSRVNAAFFTANGWVSGIFFVGVLLS